MESALVVLVLLVAANADLLLDNSTGFGSLNFGPPEIFINTQNHVHHMEQDLYRNDSRILFADWSVLKTTSQVDGNEVVVASGFSGITGFKQLNSTHLAVVDHGAHCIKMVSRRHNSVDVLAGECGKAGYTDGNPGLFNSPWSIEIDISNSSKLFVTDWYNQALRFINMKTGAVITIIKEFPFPRGMAWRNSRLLVTNEYYISEVVWRDDRSSVTQSVLAGSNSTAGYIDGDFKLSRFNNLHEIYLIADDVLLVAEHSDRKLRLLDIARHQVLPVCTNSVSHCNVSSNIGNPLSILRISDDVFVGSYKRIYKLGQGNATSSQACEERHDIVFLKEGEKSTNIEVYDGVWLTFGEGTHNYTTTKNCTHNITIVGNGSNTTTSSLPTTPKPHCMAKNITVTLQKGETSVNVEVSRAKWLRFGVGTHKYTADSSGGKCILSITVVKNASMTTSSSLTTTLKPRCESENITITLKKGETSVNVKVSTGRWLKLGVGAYEYTDVSDGNCTTSITVEDHSSGASKVPFTTKHSSTRVTSTTKPSSTLVPLTTKPTPACTTRNVTVTLKDKETRARVEVSSGRWLTLGAGTHEYADFSGGNCTVTITVMDTKMPQRLNSQLCPASIMKVASPETRTAVILIPDGLGANRQLELPVGVFPYQYNIPFRNLVCNIQISVIDPELRKKLVFQADYNVTCAEASAAIAEHIVYAMARHHFAQIDDLCGKYCKPDKSRKPVIACNGGMLRIIWPTEMEYGGEVVELNADLWLALSHRVFSKGRSFALTVLSRNPPILYPIRNRDGSSVSFTLTPFCIKSTYNPKTRQCV